jgi:hypothetical protein
LFLILKFFKISLFLKTKKKNSEYCLFLVIFKKCLFFIISKDDSNPADELSSKNEATDSTSSSVGGLTKLIDHELLTFISKLAFQNTNMNSNWKVFFLRNLLRSVILNESFSHLRQDLEVDEFLYQQMVNSMSVNESNEDVTSTSSTLPDGSQAEGGRKSAVGLDKLEKNLSKSSLRNVRVSQYNTSLEDLRLNLKSQAVLGVCDDATQFLILPSDSLASYQSTLSDKRNKFSLKLFENSIEKISNFYINNKASTITTTTTTTTTSSVTSTHIQDQTVGSSGASLGARNTSLSKLTPQQGLNATTANANAGGVSCMQPAIRNTIKLISSAITVLTCRELVILFINLATRTQLHQIQQNGPHASPNVKLNCQTEYEFLQLTDILYYTENLMHYKLFIKNLISNLIR